MNVIPRSCAALALALALSSLAPAAQADTASDFKKATELFQQKKCSEALPLFESVVAETQSPNARIYVARCLKDAGRLDEAYEAMRRTVTEATQKAEQEPKYVPTRDSAAAELALLEPKVGKLVVAIVEAPEGATVYVGPKRLEDDKLGVPVAVMPGTIELRAEAPGMAPIDRSVDVAAGKTRTLTLSFEPAGDEDPDVTPPPDDGGSDVDALAISGYVVTGLGLVGLGVGAGLTAKAKGDFDSLAEECGNQTCPEDQQAAVDDGRSLTTIGNATLIAGGVVAAAGIGLIVYATLNEDSSDSASLGPSPSATLDLLPVVGPTMNGLVLTGTF